MLTSMHSGSVFVGVFCDVEIVLTVILYVVAVQVNTSELGLVTQTGKVIWGEFVTWHCVCVITIGTDMIIVSMQCYLFDCSLVSLLHHSIYYHG